MNTGKIKSLREQLGLSQEAAARQAGLSGRQVWYQIESGKQKNLTLSTLERIAKVLKVKAADLLK